MPALLVERLSKRFGDRVAFDDVSLEVGHGEVFGFLGPNGAGKTTMVRTLGTLLAPSAGAALVAGIPLRPDNGVEIRRRIAIMPESPGLYLRLSVTENLECLAGLYGVPDAPGRIGRALRAVHELLAALSRGGVTIFLTTHRLEEAERLCDRVAILNTTLRTIGRPDELRQRLFARPAVATALVRAPDLLAQLLFTPLVAGWSIWVGIAISARASDLRVAQQLGILASLPTALLAGNGLGWRVVSAAFDRERLVAGTR